MTDWVFRAGSRTLELGGALRGLGLMRVPTVKPVLARETFTNVRSDGQRFGPGYRVGQTITLEVEALPDTRPLAEVWDELLSVWRSDEIREDPNQYATLTSDTGLTAYGHAVDIDPSLQYRLFGIGRAELTFSAVDDLWYGDEEITLISLAPTFTGGLPVPAEVPFVLGGGTGASDHLVNIGGSAQAGIVYELHGPIQNPWINIAGIGRVNLTVSLAYDQTLTLDTRHWRSGIRRGDAAYPGALAANGLRLSDLRLSPGSHLVTFGGYDPSGTSQLRVRVWPARSTF